MVLRFIPKDFSVVTVFNIAAKVLQLVVTVVLVRVLTVGDYASYTVFLTMSSTVLGVAGQSISLAYVRYSTECLSRDSSYRDGLIVASHGFNFLCFAFMLACSYPLAQVMGTEFLIVVAAVVYGFLLGMVQLNIAFFQSREMYGRSGVVENVKQIALLGLIAVAIVFCSGSLGSILFSYCFSGVACFAVSAAMIYRVITHGDASVSFDVTAGKEFLIVSIWLILYSVATQLYSQVNITMLACLSSQQDVAEFGVASRYFSMVLFLLPSIKTVLRVRMSKAEIVDSTAKQRSFATAWFKRTAVPFALAVAVCCVVSQFVFPLLNGPEYDAAIPMFQILCINAFSAYLFAPASALIMSLNRYGLQFAIAVVSLAINLGGNCLLIPLCGGVGASVATTVSQVFLNIAMTVVVFRVGAKAKTA